MRYQECGRPVPSLGGKTEVVQFSQGRAVYCQVTLVKADEGVGCSLWGEF